MTPLPDRKPPWLDPDRPWDHAYESGPDNVCVTCGWVGSYAHTEAFYRKWVWPALDPDPLTYVEPDPEPPSSPGTAVWIVAAGLLGLALVVGIAGYLASRS